MSSWISSVCFEFNFTVSLLLLGYRQLLRIYYVYDDYDEVGRRWWKLVRKSEKIVTVTDATLSRAQNFSLGVLGVAPENTEWACDGDATHRRISDRD